MIINGYKLEEELQTRNGGNCKWGFGKKDGRVFFIKELLNPVYPVDEVKLSDTVRARKKKICEDFQARQSQLYKALNDHSDGVLLHIEDFFRCQSKYYVVTSAIKGLPWDQVIKSKTFTWEDRLRMSRVLIHALNRMHQASIIHGDLKPDNVMMTLSKTNHVTCKIIDFEDAYWTSESPKPGDDVKCDVVYMAPETFRLMCGDNIRLTQGIDVFALGLILYQIMMGRFPEFDKEKYTYPFEVVLNGDTLKLRTDLLPPVYSKIIPMMLQADPEKRIPLYAAEDYLNGIKLRRKPAAAAKPEETTDTLAGSHGAAPVKEEPGFSGSMSTGAAKDKGAETGAPGASEKAEIHRKFDKPSSGTRPESKLVIKMGPRKKA